MTAFAFTLSERLGWKVTVIVEYAARLLPRAQRGKLVALREVGPHVMVKRAESEPDLYAQAIAQGVDLVAEYPQGTVALIGPDPRKLIAVLRRQQAVVTDVKRHFWRLPSGASFAVLAPTEARGLEFDGVVVVEPDAFPDDRLGNGTLYTSLTRANRELRVVHFSRLPEPLRKAR